MKQDDVSRRSFLKGAGVVGLSFATLGALPACAAQDASASKGSASNASDLSWDIETDVLVVGSGTAAFAALTAKSYGVEKVTIIEKSTAMGGTSATSGGTLWIPLNFDGQKSGMNDTREDTLKYMKAVADGRGNDAAMEVYADNANALLEWTRDTFGWEWANVGMPGVGFKDYYEPYEGFRAQGRHVNLGGAGGSNLWSQLQKDIEELGVEVLTGTAANELIVDDSGTVLGVKALDGKKELLIKASKCVVLGTGGFDHNAEMVKAYQSIPIYVTNAAAGNVGDAQIMGAAIGAALSNMDTNWGVPSFIPEPFDRHADAIFSISLTDWGVYRGGAGSIVVNKTGKRFANESSAYPVFNRAFANYDTSIPDYANMPAVWLCDSNYLASGLLPDMKAPEDPVPDNFFKADTLDEIAEHFGIDPQGLAQEIERFNAFAKQGVDSDWHRGEKQSDLAIGGTHPYMSELPNPVLAALETPPFYASLYGPGTCGTNGGLKTNEYAQVLNVRGDVIPGLLAVGNCSASITGGQYCGAGMTLGAGAVMSWVGIKKVLDIQ